ncbi:tRNA pseudouridine(38-40) synthase TruA [Virgibacillus xinjiangensis]|uniref:tRNA pseudouridine synthase A n=1 Tax=Virgibacillus xinjiangensis TaxID=393090 RepID=A0ABV7CX20_9BACI
MRKIKCIVTYDGSRFSGYQIQPGQRTVQGELEKALAKIHKGSHTGVHASGRTDAGVHAIRQVFHFETSYQIPEEKWKKAINSLLPGDIYITSSEEVASSFHSRFDVKRKEYRYYVSNTVEPNVFWRNYVFHFAYQLNLESMQEACRHLEGTHDFTSFTSAKATTKGSKIRTIYHASCSERDGQIEFIFRGNGFLYNMVRIIIGTLLDIGQGRKKPEDIQSIIGKKDRKYAGETAPPQGLYLWKVIYEENDEEIPSKP